MSEVIHSLALREVIGLIGLDLIVILLLFRP